MGGRLKRPWRLVLTPPQSHSRLAVEHRHRRPTRLDSRRVRRNHVEGGDVEAGSSGGCSFESVAPPSGGQKGIKQDESLWTPGVDWSLYV